MIGFTVLNTLPLVLLDDDDVSEQEGHEHAMLVRGHSGVLHAVLMLQSRPSGEDAEIKMQLFETQDEIDGF